MDLSGRVWDAHAPLHRSADHTGVENWIALAPDATILLDAVFTNQDEEYLEAMALQRLKGTPKTRAP